jgi:uncharacterized protein YdaU (DUF1376 family)
MNKPPAFQFYADDFLSGTMAMTNEEAGLYIRLLCLQWSQGAITSIEIERLGYGMAQPSVSHVAAKFKDDGKGKLRNERMEIVRGEQQAYRANRSESGKRGADKRWHSHGTAIAQPMANTMANDSSPSPTPIIHTHTADVPSLTEIKAFAATNGIRPESAQSFFDHHEGNQLWVNQHGRAINWKHKLVAWATNDRANPKKGAAQTEKPNGPKLAEVTAYAKDKWSDDPRHLNWAISFHRYWSDPKRNWKRADKTIDWQIEFSKQAAGWRT